MGDDDMIRRRDVLDHVGLNAWKHEGDDPYSKGMDAGARHQAQVIYDALRALPAASSEDVRAGARIIPMHTASMYGVCIGGRWDGWVMVKHPDGYWVSHNKPDPIDPAATFNLIPGAKP